MIDLRPPTINGLDLGTNPFYDKIIFFAFLRLRAGVFLRASAMLKHVIDIGWTSVCLSVRLSVTRWHCMKTAEHIVMISSPHDSPFILVLCIPDLRDIPTGSPPAGALNTGGV